MPTRDACRIDVYQNGEPIPWYRVLQIQRSTGGGRLDNATLVEDLAKSEHRNHIVDFQFNEALDNEIEIVATRLDTNETRVLHWGKVIKNALTIREGDPGMEASVFSSRIQKYHFGTHLHGWAIINPDELAGDFLRLDLPIVFNPIIDGKTVGNRRQLPHVSDADLFVFIHPEAVRTSASQTYQFDTGNTQWTLADVVKYVCWFCNFEEKYITNPTRDELEELFDEEHDLVRNLHLPMGLYLPDVLDQVLEPFGYSWFVELPEPGVRRIKLFKRGAGTDRVYVTLEPPGTTLEIAEDGLPSSNVAGLEVEYDFSNLWNQVAGYGSCIEIESTFELYRAWGEDDDDTCDTDLETLNKKHVNFGGAKDVWRKWVLNEAGDYNTLRKPDETIVAPIPGTYDLKQLLIDVIGEDGEEGPFYSWGAAARRRKFLPTLTLNDSDKSPAGKTEGVHVQYWDTNTGSWLDWPHGCDILEKECGVYFNDQFPPREIYRHGVNAKVRVTATIQYDCRLFYRAKKQDTSINAEVVELPLDLSHRYHLRKRDPLSYFQSAPGGFYATNEDDDREAIQKYCDNIRDTYDIGTVSGPITLEGVDQTYFYELGLALAGVNGRTIKFNGNTRPDGEPSLPVIVGLTVNHAEQTVALQLEHYRSAKKFLIDQQGIDA